MSSNRNLTSENTELRREVGLFGGVSVLAGIMVGSGIFYIGAIVLERAHMSLGLALLVWLAGGLVTLMSGICYAELGAMIQGGDYYLGTAAANSLFGNLGGIIVGAAMVLAIFNSLNGCVMVFPRTYYAMARDGAFFKSMAKLHPTYKTPVNALLASAAVSIALVCARNLSQLTSLVAFSGMIFNILIFCSVVVLRKKYPDIERPYKVWGYPVMIVLVVVIMIGLMLNTLSEDPVTSVIGLAVPALGLVLYELIFKKSREAVKRQQNEEN